MDYVAKGVDVILTISAHALNAGGFRPLEIHLLDPVPLVSDDTPVRGRRANGGGD